MACSPSELTKSARILRRRLARRGEPEKAEGEQDDRGATSNHLAETSLKVVSWRRMARIAGYAWLSLPD